MTTTKTTTKAPAAIKAAQSKASKPSIQVSAFTVTERWVRITATIREDHYPQFRPEADPAMAILSMIESRMVSLSIHTAAAKENAEASSMALYDISMDAFKWGYNRIGTLNLKNGKPITFQVRELEWLQFIANCEFIGHPPEAVIRGAFGARATGAERPGCRRNALKGGEA